MPVKRRVSKRHAFTEYHAAELLTGEAPLLAGMGYYDPSAPGRLAADKRDVAAMRADWLAHGESLIAWWVGEASTHDMRRPWAFVVSDGPGTRPWGFWQFEAPEPLGDDEEEVAYLRRHGLMRPGEEERLAAGLPDDD